MCLLQNLRGSLYEEQLLRKLCWVYPYRATCERNICSRMTQQMPRCRRYVSYRHFMNLRLFVDTLPSSEVFFFFSNKMESWWRKVRKICKDVVVAWRKKLFVSSHLESEETWFRIVCNTSWFVISTETWLQ